MSQVFINGVLTEVGQGADEIISLRRQLEEKDAEIERINSSPTIEACRQMISDKAVIEASMLREFIVRAISSMDKGFSGDARDYLEAALSTMPDNTALREMLDRHVAEKNAKIERLNKNLLWSMQCTAESEAREQQLRESVAKVIYSQWSILPEYKVWVDGGNSLKQDEARRLADKALSIPQDDTVLREVIARAVEVMRERCVIELYKRDDEFITERAIRAIPGMTLEDLKCAK